MRGRKFVRARIIIQTFVRSFVPSGTPKVSSVPIFFFFETQGTVGNGRKPTRPFIHKTALADAALLSIRLENQFPRRARPQSDPSLLLNQVLNRATSPPISITSNPIFQGSFSRIQPRLNRPRPEMGPGDGCRCVTRVISLINNTHRRFDVCSI